MRRGVSILEVMFAMLIATVGLLGAIAVFPVASSMARRGRINDQAAAAGRSAVHDFDARGFRQPAKWIGHTTNWDRPATGNPHPPGYTSLTPVTIKLPPTATDPNPTITIPGVRWPLGTAFCIDPRVIARATAANAADVSLFPAATRQPIANVPMAHPNSVDPRMYRISLTSGLRDAQGNLIYDTPMQQLLADSIFQLDDDLSYDRPDEDRSLPGAQLPIDWTASKRETEGHLSWMATLVPKTEMVQTVMGERVLFAAKPTDEYVLSVVIYHDRDMVEGERLVTGQLQSDGATGGEVLLTDMNADSLKLKAYDWVLLAGVYAYDEFNLQGTTTIGKHLSNVPAFGWYRVTDVDEVDPVNGNDPAQRYATLMGQDWNTQAVVNPRNGVTAQGSVQVTIVEGVVAVYEKTVRLEY